MRLWWFGFLVVLGLAGCGGSAASTSNSCAGNCGEFSIFDPGSEAAGYAQDAFLQRELAQFALTLASVSPLLAEGAAGASIASSPPTLGVACTSPSNGTSTCSINAVQHVVAANVDEGESATMTVSASASGSVTTLRFSNTSGVIWDAALNQISVYEEYQSPVVWAFSQVGASTYSVTFTDAASVTNGVLSGLTFSVFDDLTNSTASLGYSAGTQVISGVITQTGSMATIASLSVSNAGNGTITYGTGTVATVTGWVIQS